MKTILLPIIKILNKILFIVNVKLSERLRK